MGSGGTSPMRHTDPAPAPTPHLHRSLNAHGPTPQGESEGRNSHSQLTEGRPDLQEKTALPGWDQSPHLLTPGSEERTQMPRLGPVYPWDLPSVGGPLPSPRSNR